MPYIDQSRSVRSQEAIEKGLVVKSQLKAWQKRAVDQGAVFPCEWHHKHTQPRMPPISIGGGIGEQRGENKRIVFTLN